jgi:ATP-dependent RNA helicase RhlE
LSFSQFAVSDEILRTIRDRGHHSATLIQSEAIPVALSGNDLMASAETGSGKTAAYLVPLIDRLFRKRARNLSAIVLAPTRELAAQIGREFQILARHTGIRAAVVYGGASMGEQIQALRSGAQVLIACPGRLIDHLGRGSVKFNHIELVVIDEADRLMDMGFLPQLREIMRKVPEKRQVMMFSATISPEVSQIAREFLRNPVRVKIGDIEKPPVTIEQKVYAVVQEDKARMLLTLLEQSEVESAIVFTRTRSRADRVAKFLCRNRVNAVAIHGDRSQSQRNSALAGFRSRRYRVLVATDVAARGLDISDVSHVINFDLPEEAAGYVHRIGRTARMGKAGQALSLVAPDERDKLAAIERSMATILERVKLDGFEAPEISAPKPVKLFRSIGNRRRVGSRRPRLSWHG